MVLFYIIHLFLCLTLVLFLQLQTKTALFRFFQYSLDVNLKFLLILTIVLNYNRFSFLIFLNNISILIYFHLVFSMSIFLYTILFIHYGGKVPFSYMKIKKKPQRTSFFLIIESTLLV